MTRPVEPVDVLVCMPCSERKRSIGASAAELYDGPLWQTLRCYLGQIPPANVLVVSGKYGLVDAGTRLDPYEQLLDASKAAAIICREILPVALAHSRRRSRPYGLVIVAGVNLYGAVYSALIDAFRDKALIMPGTEIRRVIGGIGEQRSQLGRWLRQASQPLEAAQ